MEVIALWVRITFVFHGNLPEALPLLQSAQVLIGDIGIPSPHVGTVRSMPPQATVTRPQIEAPTPGQAYVVHAWSNTGLGFEGHADLLYSIDGIERP
jgi:hypothetical protein